MNTFEYSNLLFIQWRTGSVDDPYVDLVENRKISKNTIVLHEIPDEVYRVRITGYTEQTMEQYKKTKTIGLNEFVVNYNVGFVLFNEARNGTTLTITYKGRGVIMYPAERIYYDHQESETITKTLQDLAVLGEIALINVGSLDDLQEKIDLAVATKSILESQTETGDDLITSLQSSISTGNTAKTNLDTSTSTANTARTNLNTSITNATDIIAEIATGEQLKTDLNSTISSGNTAKTNLDTSISTANTTKTNLDTSNTTANTTKTNLDTSNTTANTTKTNLETATTNANTAKTNLDTSISNAEGLSTEISTGQQLKTDLNSSISTGNTLKTNLDSSISTGNTTSTTLNGSVEAGQNKIEEMDAKIAEANTAITNTNTAKDNTNDLSTRLSVFETYDNTKVYYPLNKVAQGGSSYVCILQTTAGTMPSNTTYWTMIAQAGSGNVSSVNGDASGDVIVASPTGNAVISVNSGTGANQLLKIGSDGLIPISLIPNKSSIRIVADSTARLALTGLVSGDTAYENTTGDSYVWDGSVWKVIAKGNWINAMLSNANASTTGTMTISGGLLTLDNGVSNLISFKEVGFSLPSATGGNSAKVQLWNKDGYYHGFGVSSGKIIVTSNLVDKISGSVVENPSSLKRTVTNSTSTTLLSPSALTSEYSTSDYTKASTINGTNVSSTTTTNLAIAQHVASFDLVTIVERKYGSIGANLAAKVAWLKVNIMKLTINWYGYGSNPTGNKAYLRWWNSSSWQGSPSHTNGTVTKLENVLNNSDIVVNNHIDDNGFVHYNLYSDASNGTISSAIHTDYVELITDVAPPTTETWYVSSVFHKWYSQNNVASALPTSIMTLDGVGNLTARTFVSSVADGISPIAVTSKTEVTNLNTEFLNGKKSTDFVHVGTTAPINPPTGMIWIDTY